MRHAHRGHMEGLEDWGGGLGCILGAGNNVAEETSCVQDGSGSKRQQRAWQQRQQKGEKCDSKAGCPSSQAGPDYRSMARAKGSEQCR